MELSKIWPFQILFITHYRLEKQREDVYERDIKQQEEGIGLNRGTYKHSAVSDVYTFELKVRSIRIRAHAFPSVFKCPTSKSKAKKCSSIAPFSFHAYSLFHSLFHIELKPPKFATSFNWKSSRKVNKQPWLNKLYKINTRPNHHFPMKPMAQN